MEIIDALFLAADGLGHGLTVKGALSGAIRWSLERRLRDFLKACKQSIDESGEVLPKQEKEFAQWLSSDFAKERLNDFVNLVIDNQSQIARIALGRLFAEANVPERKTLSAKHTLYMRALQDQDELVLKTFVIVCRQMRASRSPFIEWKGNGINKEGELVVRDRNIEPVMKQLKEIGAGRYVDVKMHFSTLERKNVIHPNNEPQLGIGRIYVGKVYDEFEEFLAFVEWAYDLAERADWAGIGTKEG